MRSFHTTISTSVSVSALSRTRICTSFAPSTCTSPHLLATRSASRREQNQLHSLGNSAKMSSFDHLMLVLNDAGTILL